MVTAHATSDLTASPLVPLHDDALAYDLLTVTQHQIIALLTQGQSVAAAARAAGIHRTTIHHWRRTSSSFALALRDSERDAAQDWHCATRARADKALTALDGLLEDERTPATVRLKAVLYVLNTATTTPLAADSGEQDLLAREQQMRKRQQDREIGQIVADAEALRHHKSFEAHPVPMYEGELYKKRAARLAKDGAEAEAEDVQDSTTRSEEQQPDPEKEGGCYLPGKDENGEEGEASVISNPAHHLPVASPVHQNSSLFGQSVYCRMPAPYASEPTALAAVKYRRKKSRKQRRNRQTERGTQQM